ncbi:uncharacterized protein LOC134667644 [Cydia fagiglandana]|uniref:uncharacterized protein LOC134667644 n=1 Tax=Cydia fagiglandana TaxID=1458189 RepID=UPI002FEE24D6
MITRSKTKQLSTPAKSAGKTRSDSGALAAGGAGRSSRLDTVSAGATVMPAPHVFKSPEEPGASAAGGSGQPTKLDTVTTGTTDTPAPYVSKGPEAPETPRQCRVNSAEQINVVSPSNRSRVSSSRSSATIKALRLNEEAQLARRSLEREQQLFEREQALLQLQRDQEVARQRLDFERKLFEQAKQVEELEIEARLATQEVDGRSNTHTVSQSYSRTASWVRDVNHSGRRPADNNVDAALINIPPTGADSTTVHVRERKLGLEPSYIQQNNVNNPINPYFSQERDTTRQNTNNTNDMIASHRNHENSVVHHNPENHEMHRDVYKKPVTFQIPINDNSNLLQTSTSNNNKALTSMPLLDNPNNKQCQLPSNQPEPYFYSQRCSHKLQLTPFSENLVRLSGALRGAALESVSSLLYTAERPEQVLDVLEQTFALPEMIVLHEITLVRNLPKLSFDQKDLTNFACRLRNCIAVIRNLDQIEHIYSVELFHSVLSKLTPILYSQWKEFAYKNDRSVPKIQLLSEFLDIEAIKHNRYGLVPDYARRPGTVMPDLGRRSGTFMPELGRQTGTFTSGLGRRNGAIISESGRRHGTVGNNNFSHKPTRSENIHVTSVRNTNNELCRYCNNKHKLTECEEFKSLSLDDKWIWLREAKICSKCLVSKSHRWKSCRIDRCGVDGCERFHHPLLHSATTPHVVNAARESPSSSCDVIEHKNINKTVTISNVTGSHSNDEMLSPESQVFLRVIPVEVSGPHGKYDTYALLDDGSMSTMIDWEVARHIGATGPMQSIKVDGACGMSVHRPIQHVSFSIKGLKLLCGFPDDIIRDRQLHIFADASEEAYACVAYWRFTLTSGSVKLSLIGGKARLSPLKPTSIPRLELQASLIASRFANTICIGHEIKPDEIYFWSDSTTVLSWIRSNARTFKPFVANRVGEITEITKVTNWKFVPGGLNVADDATRLKDRDIDLSRWFSGPDFLLLPFSEWPKEPSTPETTSVLEELKPSKTHVGLINLDKPSSVVPDPSRFSEWLRLVRTTARIFQCINKFRSLLAHDNPNSKNKTNPSSKLPPLSAVEMQKAEIAILRQTQTDLFGEEFALLREAKPLPKSSKLNPLCPIIDEDGLLRLDSRIKRMKNVDYATTSPIILDGRHPAVRLLIRHYHVEAAHAFNELVINELKQRFWILRCRSEVRMVARKCAYCIKRKATPHIPPTGDIPDVRLKHHKRPFTNTGLDYFGPVEVSIGRRREKRWIALFTCMTTRAVHLEIVASLSSDSAIMSIRRFAARRGLPNKILSDNGTSFVGANRQLCEFYSDAVQDFAASKRIEWCFIPPASPFMGGCWERLVKTVKTALLVTLKERAPREELLHTLLLEVEALVNSRPLTYVTENREYESLTPSHFLIGTSSPQQLPAVLDDGVFSSRKEWQKVLRLSEHFWTRWLKEYLPSLKPRRNNGRQYHNLKIDDVVLVVDPDLPRGVWPIGRIVEVFPGRDGIVRVADVATKGGLLRRPARKLARLHEEVV